MLIYDLPNEIVFSGNNPFDTGISQSSLGSNFIFEISYTRSSDVSGFQGLIGLHGNDHQGIWFQSEDGAAMSGGFGDGIKWAGNSVPVDAPANASNNSIHIVTPTTVTAYNNDYFVGEITRDAGFVAYPSNVILGRSFGYRYFKGTVHSFKIYKF